MVLVNKWISLSLVSLPATLRPNTPKPKLLAEAPREVGPVPDSFGSAALTSDPLPQVTVIPAVPTGE